MQQEAQNREDVLFLLQITWISAAASCFIGLIFAAFRYCHNSIKKLNITPFLILASNSPSLMMFALHDGIIIAFRAFVVMFSHIETFLWFCTIRPP
jgi:ABC-type amino acid transport system permease subunit